MAAGHNSKHVLNLQRPFPSIAILADNRHNHRLWSRHGRATASPTAPQASISSGPTPHRPQSRQWSMPLHALPPSPNFLPLTHKIPNRQYPLRLSPYVLQVCISKDVLQSPKMGDSLHKASSRNTSPVIGHVASWRHTPLSQATSSERAG